MCMLIIIYNVAWTKHILERRSEEERKKSKNEAMNNNKKNSKKFVESSKYST